MRKPREIKASQLKFYKKLIISKYKQASIRDRFVSLLFVTILIETFLLNNSLAISIKPADFDRLIMYCYLGGPAPSANSYNGPSYGQSSLTSPMSGYGTPIGAQSTINSANQLDASGGRPRPFNQQQPGSYQAPSYFGGSNGDGLNNLNRQVPPSTGSYIKDGGFANLGQSIPRANTIDNFIALVTKIEAANQRLASNPDQLIRMLLGRFRMDNFYYDIRSRTSIDERDHRVRDMIPALLNYTFQQQFSSQMPPTQYLSPMEEFQENLLEADEKCSMYFMLSHFIVKEQPLNPPLAGVGAPQLAGPIAGQRPPNLQAAGTGYPAQSANAAFNNMNNNQTPNRFAGPSPSFGSPATNNMNSFGSGIGNPEYTGSNPGGMNSLQPNYNFNSITNNIRQPGPYSGTSISNSKPFGQVPYIDGGASNLQKASYLQREEKIATEYGVVAVPNQDNAGIVLNRVLMGILASNVLSQPIRQLASVIYSNKYISATGKLDEDIDPLYAVTLADLWATSAIPKAGKQFDFKLLGNNGRWNDTMCPTTFTLERANSIKFTTAEMLGGLDGFNLGMVRKELLARGRNLRLSDLLKMYYSKAGFRPQLAEYSVCNRATGINMHLDDLRRQADNYLRLYQLDSPTNDNDLANLIQRLDSFKEFLRTASQIYTPTEICQDSGSSYNDIYPQGGGESTECEIGKADVVSVLDSSPQANELFMTLVLSKLAHKIGLSRWGNSFTILTNQQDTTGYAGSYSFNAILRNSTNTAEVGCSLILDQSRSYQGGQITEPARLVEMFERALVNLDTEYLVRQNMGQQQMQSSSWSSSYTNSKFVSSLFNYGDSYSMSGLKPRNTGGAKIIIWFNYGNQPRPNQLSNQQTNWNQNQPPTPSLYPDGPRRDTSNLDYKFYEAKRYLKENFRGAAILAVANNKDDVRAFVDEEQRDIFLELPQSSSSGGVGSDYYPTNQVDANSIAQLNGPADILVNKLLQRMCDVPAVFQYAMCFRAPSDNVPAVGYISPRRKQYWMMSPKTFFSSSTVRMVFKVDGGRLRVCFGRMPKPDDSATRNPQYQQYGYQSGIPVSSMNQQQGGGGGGGISLISPGNGLGGQYGSQNNNPTTQNSNHAYSSGNNYYTGLDYGICKDVSPGQEIDFIVDDPCYKKPIAECEPFYFVIKEITNPGEGDPNYMCRDVGCKRFDQVRFTMTHTGVACSSAFKSIKTNWLLMMISIATAIYVCGANEIISITNSIGSKIKRSHKKLSYYPTMQSFVTAKSTAIIGASLCLFVQQAQAQLSAPADYGQGRYGEKRGNFTPSEVLAIILLIMTIVAGLALTIGLCYYVHKKNFRGGMQKIPQNDFS